VARDLPQVCRPAQLVGDDKDLDDETRLMLLSFVGVRSGPEAENQEITELTSNSHSEWPGNSRSRP